MTNEAPTITERYLTASSTSSLRLVETERTAADVITAAGLVTISDRDRDLVTLMWSMREQQRRFLFETAFEIATRRFINKRKGRRTGLNKYEKDGIRKAMFWWIQQAPCSHCEGRGHPTVQEPRPHLDELRLCESCGGTGRVPMRKLVRPECREVAQDFLDDFERMQEQVSMEMGKKLRKALDE